MFKRRTVMIQFQPKYQELWNIAINELIEDNLLDWDTIDKYELESFKEEHDSLVNTTLMLEQIKTHLDSGQSTMSYPDIEFFSIKISENLIITYYLLHELQRVVQIRTLANVC
jgi:hypothetical protein